LAHSQRGKSDIPVDVFDETSLGDTKRENESRIRSPRHCDNLPLLSVLPNKKDIEAAWVPPFFLLLFLFSLSHRQQSGCVIHILETVTIHTLLKKALALGTRLGVAEILLTGHSVFADAHNEHIAVLEFGGVTKLLNTVPLSVNGILTVTTSATATAYAIRGYTDDFPSMDKHGNVKAGAINLSHPTGIGICQKSLEQGIMPLTSRLH
jgi:hypothetical protein